MAYIYEISNDINDKLYIGKTEDSIEKRFKQHCREAFRKRCEKRPLYAAMRLYGIEHFHIALLEETNEPEAREAYWIALKNSYRYGYNATHGGDGSRYLDYELIYNTYINCQNANEVAASLGVSTCSVRKIVHSYGYNTKTNQEVNKAKFGKSIKMYSLDGTFEVTFSTLHEAAEFLQANGFTSIAKAPGIIQKIVACANGGRKTAFKKLWQW
jgi:group I intron endonuclease